MNISRSLPDDTDESEPIQMETALSIIVPVYNESKNVQPLVREIQSVLSDVSDSKLHPYEIIFIDDGSDDGTREILQSLAQNHHEITAIFLRRNFGQSAALAAGFDAATGKVIVPMDGDGQNDPADIQDLVATLDEGYDCVSGWRRNREDPLSKRIPSRIQTFFAGLVGVKIHDFGCTIKAYRREAIEDIKLYGEGHRYIPAQLHKRGYAITEIEVNHRPRTQGETKYGISRLVKGFIDLFFVVFWNRYSTRPLHFLGSVGMVMMGLGGVIGVHAIFMKYFFGLELVPRTPRLILTIGLILFGFQLIMFGVVAEMFTKLYYRSDRPYRIQEVIKGEEN